MTLDARAAARDFLRDALAGGERPTSALLAQAKSQGLSERTLRRAFRDLRGLVRKEGFGVGAAWRWRLEHDRQPQEPGQLPENLKPPTPNAAQQFASRATRIDDCQICRQIRRVAIIDLAPKLALYCCQECCETGKTAMWTDSTGSRR